MYEASHAVVMTFLPMEGMKYKDYDIIYHVRHGNGCAGILADIDCHAARVLYDGLINPTTAQEVSGYYFRVTQFAGPLADLLRGN